jgi:hypothetical protein
MQEQQRPAGALVEVVDARAGHIGVATPKRVKLLRYPHRSAGVLAAEASLAITVPPDDRDRCNQAVVATTNETDATRQPGTIELTRMLPEPSHGPGMRIAVTVRAQHAAVLEPFGARRTIL